MYSGILLEISRQESMLKVTVRFWKIKREGAGGKWGIVKFGGNLQ
jgi:hypothetical protein